MPASSGLEALLQRPAEDAEVAASRAAPGRRGDLGQDQRAGDDRRPAEASTPSMGPPNNPWNLERTCGGSSGGAAAMLAAGVTALEIGSDIGGSLRVPANFCGVFSHKPTWGLVPQAGHVPPKPGTVAPRDLNVVGPMARSVRDLRLLLSLIAPGVDGARATRRQPLKDLEALGLWLDESRPFRSTRGCARSGRGVRGTGFAARGERLIERVRPVDTAVLIPAYRTLLSSALASDMPPVTLRRMEQIRGRHGQPPAPRGGLGRTHSELHRQPCRVAGRRRGARQARPAGRRVVRPADGVIAPDHAGDRLFAHDHQPMGDRKLCSASDRQGLRLLPPSSTGSPWPPPAASPATAIPAGLAADGLPVGVQTSSVRRGGDARTFWRSPRRSKTPRFHCPTHPGAFMTVLSGQTIRRLGIVTPFAERTSDGGVTYGLGPAGYDLRIDLGDEFDDGDECVIGPGRFQLAATP